MCEKHDQQAEQHEQGETDERDQHSVETSSDTIVEMMVDGFFEGLASAYDH